MTTDSPAFRPHRGRETDGWNSGMHYEAPSGIVERWQPELDRLAMPSERGPSWFKLIWEPGEPWAVVGRWVVWEMSPACRAPLDAHDQLRGPNPRWFGAYDEALDRFVQAKAFLISQRQWWEYRRHGYYGTPVWVVQGERGGHKRYWTPIESKISVMNGGPADPPEPGSLRYAEPDQRTISQLGQLDMIRKYGDVLHLLDSRPALRAELDRREREQAEEMARQLWNWLGDQALENLTLTNKQEQEMWEHASDTDPVPDWDREHEEFIEEVAGSYS